ncbi:Protocadherin gamma-A3 [Schistosoma japonicum]|nr:Protocadherin gamma-A3 [Schistosoma japonicum]
MRKYDTIICTENEWANMNSNHSTTNQSLYFDKNDYNQYLTENRYPRNSLQEIFFESLQNSTTTNNNYNNNNSLSKRLYNEQNIYLNPNHNLTYLTLPQQ